MEYTYSRYLTAKTTVDDKALNRVVSENLREELAQRGGPLRILEIGGGVGTMVQRLLRWGIIAQGSYTLVDADPVSIDAAASALAAWHGTSAGADAKHLHLGFGGADLDVELVAEDALTFLQSRGGFDLLIANAVLDLMHLPVVLPLLWKSLAPGGLFWLTVNFDGETIFLPEDPMDGAILELYHASMDQRPQRGIAGGSRHTGRKLLQAIPASGASLLVAGSSDWVVFPQGGTYSGDEAYFLHHIIETVRQELCNHGALDQATFAKWVSARHAQVDAAELCYIAHQLDFLGNVPAPTK